MGLEQGGGPGIGADLFAKGIGTGAGAGQNEAPPKDFDELVNKIFEQMVKVVSKFTGTRLDTALNTGVFAHTDITKAGLQVNNNILHQGLLPEARGGAIATLAGEVFSSRLDFSKLNPPPIEGLPVGEGQGIDMSFASLGTLTPMATGGTSASIEMNV